MGDEMIHAVQAGIQSAKQHSPDDFEQLFRTEWPRMVGMLSRMTGNRHRAEDLAQEAFLRLHVQRQVLQNPTAWLYRVTVRLGLDAIRSDRRRGRWEQGAAALNSLPSTPDTQFQLAERQKLVGRVLERMTKRSAQLLILRYSGLSFAEVAEIIGRRVSSVGTLLDRAERDFKKRYLRMSKGARP